MNSDSPASSSSSLGIKSKIIPTVASHWKLPHLEKFGILYADKPSTISELLNHANSFAETKQDVKSIPRLSNVLMEFCRNLWTISYDFRNQSWLEAREKIFEVDKLKANFELREKEMTENIKDRLGVDYKMMRFFHYWSMNMLEFWTYFGDLLGRFKKDYQREERFTYLFMAFSKMFFLRPEGGEAYTTSIKIKAVDVRGMPDIRYIMPRKGETGEKLFIVTEVKKYNAFRGEYTADTFTYKNISNYVLGQHGIELIMERKESHLFPGVLGMICIGTQIIFTFLNITNDHYVELLDDAVDRKHKASIIYTRPYDFMDEADRNELLEPFFWLGYIQTERYSVYGPSQVFTTERPKRKRKSESSSGSSSDHNDTTDDENDGHEGKSKLVKKSQSDCVRKSDHNDTTDDENDGHQEKSKFVKKSQSDFVRKSDHNDTTDDENDGHQENSKFVKKSQSDFVMMNM